RLASPSQGSNRAPQPVAAGDSQFGPRVESAAGWRVDAHHSRVAFSAMHMGIITVHGVFETVEVELDLDPADLTRSSVVARIDASSVSTADERRDADLRSNHFLDVATY